MCYLVRPKSGPSIARTILLLQTWQERSKEIKRLARAHPNMMSIRDLGANWRNFDPQARTTSKFCKNRTVRLEDQIPKQCILNSFQQLHPPYGTYLKSENMLSVSPNCMVLRPIPSTLSASHLSLVLEDMQ